MLSSWQLQRLLSLGIGFYCPACNSHLRRFRSHPSDPGQQWDCLCPVCGSKSPHRRAALLFRTADRYQLRMAHVLHISPELHLSRLLRAKSRNYVSGDIRPGVGDLVFSITQLPFPDDSFDFLYCCHVLPMLPAQDVRQAVAECFRVLKPSACSIIENPVGNGKTIEMSGHSAADRAQRWYHGDVLRLFGADDYWDMFREAGFVLDPVTLSQASQEVVSKMRLYMNEITLLKKPPHD